MLKDRFSLLAVFALMLSFAAGCETLGIGDEDDDSDDIENRDDTIGRTSADMQLPARAEPITSNTNGNVNYRADRDGTIYVVDETDNRVVLKQDLQAGDRFFFDGDNGRVEVNGRSLPTTDLDKLDNDHDYKVYFARQKGRASNDSSTLDDGDNVDAVR
jgi:hypothetical protein